MNAFGIGAALAGAVLIAASAWAADDKALSPPEICHKLSEQYYHADKSKVPAGKMASANALMKRGENLCHKDRFESGADSLRKAIKGIGLSPEA